MATTENTFRESPSTKKKVSTDLVIGQPCWRCNDKCSGGYMPFGWTKKCQNCGCTRHCHQDINYFKNLLSISSSQSPKDDKLSSEDKANLESKYSWYPKGVEHAIVEKYMSSLPKDYIPYIDSGKRLEILNSQHPLQDGNPSHCEYLPDIEKKRMAKFGERMNRKFFGVGKVSLQTNSVKVCHECSTKIKEYSVVVTAPDRVPNEKMWHSECFRCHKCSELLVDLMYYYSPETDEVYCGKHHAETIVPRCQGCEELIVSGTFTEAKERAWHKHHFTCSKCDQELHNKMYKYNDDGMLFCSACFAIHCAEQCVKCKAPIGLNHIKVTIEGNPLHKECFICLKCQVCLHGSKYFPQEGGAYLCENCQTRNIIAQCHACKLGINSTVTYLKHKKFAWHSECFKCAICSTWLADGEFHDMDDIILCKQCFKEKNSRKCFRCQQSILHKGIQLGLNWFHPECFTCTDCEKSLVNEKKVNSSKILCQECILKNAKMCTYCNCPITSRHTVYKGHSFHLECFKCNRCGSSIEGTEFYETSLYEILCNKCGSLR